MPRQHGISKRSFCTTGSTWPPRKSCAEEICLVTVNGRPPRSCRVQSPRLQKVRSRKPGASLSTNPPLGPAKNANLPSRYRLREPEHNFLLHQISERANLRLDARSLF